MNRDEKFRLRGKYNLSPMAIDQFGCTIPCIYHMPEYQTSNPNPELIIA
jgi:hypothetical protein